MDNERGEESAAERQEQRPSSHPSGAWQTQGRTLGGLATHFVIFALGLDCSFLRASAEVCWYVPTSVAMISSTGILSRPPWAASLSHSPPAASIVCCLSKD